MNAYVIIRLSGNRTERLLERMRCSGIPIYAIDRITDDTIEFSMRASDFHRLHPLARNSRCHVHIVRKMGTAFTLKRVLQRRALWISCLILFGLVFTASTRILYIDVQGCSKVAEQTVIRALETHGLKIGASRKGWDFPTLNNQIRLYDDRIAWVGLSLDGVVLHAKIVEMIPTTEEDDSNAPADVVAKKDGIVTRIETSSGRSCVLVGQSVLAGDTLISGDLTREDSQYPVYAHGSGLIYAKVAYTAEAIAGLEDTVLSDSGNSVIYRQVRLGNRILFTSEIPYKHHVLRDCKETLATDTFLPLRVMEGLCCEQTEQPVSRTTEEMAEAAIVDAERIAMLKIPKDASIVEKHAVWAKSDAQVIGIVTIITEESIGMTKEISFDGTERIQFD